MPNEFSVVGEHQDDHNHLLVMGTDGLYYGYFPEREQFTRLEPGDDWVIYRDRDEVDPGFFGLDMERR